MLDGLLRPKRARHPPAVEEVGLVDVETGLLEVRLIGAEVERHLDLLGAAGPYGGGGGHQAISVLQVEWGNLWFFLPAMHTHGGGATGSGCDISERGCPAPPPHTHAPLWVGAHKVVVLLLQPHVVVALHVRLILVGQAEVVVVLDIAQQAALQPAVCEDSDSSTPAAPGHATSQKKPSTGDAPACDGEKSEVTLAHQRA